MNDSSTGFPKANSIFIGNGRKEIIYFTVSVNGGTQVFFSTNFCLDQVIAVNGGWNGNTVTATGIELKKGHLCCSILHGYAVWSEINIILSTFIYFCRGFKRMGIEDFFGKCHRTVE